MFCTKCGAQLEDGAKVCNACGEAIAETNTASEAVAEATEKVTEVVGTVTNKVDEVLKDDANDPGKTLGLVSLILGIVSIALGTVCSCLVACVGGPLSSALSIAGIICGAIGMKKSKDAGFKNTKATVGLILSIVAIVLMVISLILSFVIGFGAGLFSEMGSSSYYYY